MIKMKDIITYHDCKKDTVREDSIYYNKFQKKWGVLTGEVIYCPMCGMLMTDKKDHQCKDNDGHSYYVIYNCIAKKHLTFSRHDVNYCNLCGEYVKGKDGNDEK